MEMGGIEPHGIPYMVCRVKTVYVMLCKEIRLFSGEIRGNRGATYSG